MSALDLTLTSCSQAALDLVARGWHVFPVPPGTKESHKSAEFSGGRKWGATTDPREVRHDWQRWPDAGLGLVTGPKSGVFVVEADTAEGHEVDGLGNLAALIEQHDDWPETVEALSPSGSWHIYFRWPAAGGIANSTSQVALGVDVRGDGGMVVAPPTMRPGRALPYRWKNPPDRFDLAECPKWLLDLCRKPEPLSTRASAAAPRPSLKGAPLDREQAIIQALTGEQWHDAVIRLVGSYVRRGLSDGEIRTLTDPLTTAGYTVEDTRREVQTAIDGARRKGWERVAPAWEGEPPDWEVPPYTEEDARLGSEPDDEPPLDHRGPIKQVSKGWTIQTAAEFTAGFVPPEFIIKGVVQRGRFYLLTAPTGAGKTAVMLYASTALSTGLIFADREVEQGDVLFLVGENPDDVRARFIATMESHGIDPAQCRVHFIAGTFSIRQDMALLQERAASLPNLVLVVIDTFAAYFDGDDENSNAQALNFAQLVRQITAWPSRPAVIMPAHPVKNAGRQNLSPKGGSSLLNECDGNLTLWAEEGISTLHWQGKFRGPEFEPLKFELERYTTDRLRDHKGELIPTVLAKPLLETRARQIAVQTIRDEDRLLLNVRDLPGQSFADRAVELGLKMGDGRPYKVRVQRLLEKLEKQKLVRRFRDIWELTKDGERAVEMIQSGGFASHGGL